MLSSEFLSLKDTAVSCGSLDADETIGGRHGEVERAGRPVQSVLSVSGLATGGDAGTVGVADVAGDWRESEGGGGREGEDEIPFRDLSEMVSGHGSGNGADMCSEFGEQSWPGMPVGSWIDVPLADESYWRHPLSL